ncbi:MAG TPA: hypothetical protein VF407_24325 [Polyangiaceae bacterium]
MAPTFDSPDREKSYREHLAFFDRSAHLDVDGVRYAFDETDFEKLAVEASVHIFFPPNDVNTAVFDAVIGRAKTKFRPALKRAQIFELCAATMGTTVQTIENKLAWSANYMAFHDGTDPDSYHSYPPSEE